MFQKAAWLLAATLSIAQFPTQAQEARGTLLGRVSDTSDAVISGAKVGATNLDTGVRVSSV